MNPTNSIYESFNKYTQKEYSGHKKRVFSVDWNSSGSKLGSASSDSSIRIWNLESQGLDKNLELKGHTDTVDQISWHPDNENILGSASTDKTLRIWDIRNSKPNIKIEKTKGSNLNLAWSPDGNLIGVGSKDDVLTFFDFRNNQILKSIKCDVEINEIAWDPTGSLLMITTGVDSSSSGPIYLLDGMLLQLPPLEILECHRGSCYCIAIDPLEKYFATGAADAIVAIWDLQEMICCRTYTKLEGQIRQLSFSFDGKYIATASEDEMVDILAVDSGEQLYSISCKAPQISVSWHPKKYLLVFAGEDKNRNNDEGMIHLFGMNA